MTLSLYWSPPERTNDQSIICLGDISLYKVKTSRKKLWGWEIKLETSLGRFFSFLRVRKLFFMAPWLVVGNQRGKDKVLFGFMVKVCSFYAVIEIETVL